MSDGDRRDGQTIEIHVQAGVGTAPAFVEPLASGVSFDVRRRACLELRVEVEDPDTARVVLGLEPPLIEGAKLEQTEDQTGLWSWCPSEEQLAVQRHRMALSADDGVNPKTVKSLVIVLRNEAFVCAGEPPSIVHNAEADIRLEDGVLSFTALVTDDVGLLEPPRLLVSTAEDAVVDGQVQWDRFSDTLMEGQGDVFVANVDLGDATELTYLFVVQDIDVDEQGLPCSHVAYDPPEGAYVWTAADDPPPPPPPPACAAEDTHEPDNTAEQAAVAEGLTPGETALGHLCADDVDMYALSLVTDGALTLDVTTLAALNVAVLGEDGTTVVIAGGADDRLDPCLLAGDYFVRITGDGAASGSYALHPTFATGGCSCRDDDFELNDTMAQATAMDDLPFSTTARQVCMDDDDWYRLFVNDGDIVHVRLWFAQADGDLDMELLNAEQDTLASSQSATDNESITFTVADEGCSDCPYYVLVYGYDGAEAAYALDVSVE